MSEPHDPLEARLAAIEQALAALDVRLRTLERGSSVALDDLPPSLSWRPAADISADLVSVLTLIGRTCLVFAGAYLLRALTESGTLSIAAGAELALVYATTWMAIAYRVGRRHRLSATFHGATGLLIALPLVWEATTRLALLTPTASAAALLVITGTVLLIAWHRHLPALAWIATVSTCLVSFGLLIATGDATKYASILVVLGVATLWLGYDRDWTLLRWVAAFFADVTVLALVGRALAEPPRDAPAVVMAVQLLLLFGYLASIVMRTLVRGRDVVAFEIVQTAALSIVALGGALLIAHQRGVGRMPLGAALLLFAVGCYAVEFVARRQPREINRYFYTSLALVFALTGTDLVGNGEVRSLMWLVLGLVCGWFANRFSQPTLSGHAAVYLLAAAMSSGLMTAAIGGLFAPAEASADPMEATGWGVLAAFAIFWMHARPPGVARGRAMHYMRIGFAAFVVISVAGVCAAMARTLLIPPAAAAGAAATLRTGVLALAALAVAWLGARSATREFGVLLYPILGVGALKLLFEDFRSSPPLLLVGAFAIYGAALILGPRIAGPADPLRPDTSRVHERGTAGVDYHTM